MSWRLLAGMWSRAEEVCRSFVHLRNKVSLSAETLRKVGDGYNADECRQACIDSTDFVCVAAQMQLPSSCFVIGFRLRNDYVSVHYTRVCQHGLTPVNFVTHRQTHRFKILGHNRRIVTIANLEPVLKFRKILNTCYAAAWKPRDAIVNYDPYVSNTIDSILVIC